MIARDKTALVGVDVSPARTHGLIYAFRIYPQNAVTELGWEELGSALTDTESIVWLHFDATNMYTREWLSSCSYLPKDIGAFLLDVDDKQYIELLNNTIIGVISDIQHGFEFEPDQLATLRFYLDTHCLITTRHKPMEATDRLRNAIRGGLTVVSSVTLIAYLFRSQTNMLSKITEQLETDTGLIEDQVLADKIHNQRGKLGKIRRLSTRLIRHFTPEYRLLRQVSRRFPAWFNTEDKDDFIEIIEAFGEAMNELDTVNERTKLLQEELYTKISEETNRNLFVLSIVTTVFMPISVITGIFGMNVAGLPGLQNASAFWWVIAGMIVVAILTLAILHWKRIF